MTSGSVPNVLSSLMRTDSPPAVTRAIMRTVASRLHRKRDPVTEILGPRATTSCFWGEFKAGPGDDTIESKPRHGSEVAS